MRCAMNHTGLISVIIPIYNTGKYLRPCLTSITQQTYQNLEIILVDDGSKDDSLAVCREYAKADSRIVVIAKENGGVSSARNAGIRAAHGDWFSFIDSDDYLELDAYEYLMGLIEEHHCDAVMFEYYTTYPNREVRHESFAWRYGLLDRKNAMRAKAEAIPFTVTKIFSRKLVENLFFDETIARGEDGLFNAYALHRADSVYFTQRALYHYVQSEESAVRGKFRPSQLTALRLIDHYMPFYSQHYPELLQGWLASMLHLLISLYYDMYADECDYKKEMQMVRARFLELYKKLDKKKLVRRNLVKFMFFRYLPKLYCLTHKKD